MAENLPAETYLDTGNRTSFINGGEYLDLHPDFLPKHWDDTCHPLVVEGPAVQAAKQRLLSRIDEAGYRLSDDADVHIRACDRRIDPIWIGPKRMAFMLPSDCRDAELRSRTFMAALIDAASGDRRNLGISVSRLQFDGNDLDLETLNDDSQWHELETDRERTCRWRWTTGRIRIPDSTRLVVIDMLGRGYYRDAPPESNGISCMSAAG